MTKRRLNELLIQVEGERKRLAKELLETKRVLNVRTRFMNKLYRIMEDLVIPSFEEIKADYDLANEHHTCECCLANAAPQVIV